MKILARPVSGKRHFKKMYEQEAADISEIGGHNV